MTRFISALAVSFSLLALAGVGIILTHDLGIGEAIVSHAELDALHARLNDIAERLDDVASSPPVLPVPEGRSPEPAVDEAGGEERDGGVKDEAPATTILARLETLETRLRALEEDPVQRAYTYLQSDNPDLRKRGVRSLEALARSDPQARAALRELLTDPDAGVRVAALKTLGNVGDKESVPFAASLLEDGNPAVRREAINTLTRLHATEAAASIAGFITDEDAKVRWFAVDSVGKLGYKESTGALLSAALDDESPAIRREAIFSLGEVGAREALPQLQGLYKNVTAEAPRGKGDQRYILAHVMKQLGDPRAARTEVVRLGETVLHGQNDKERGGALRGVIWLGGGDPAAREILRQAAADPNKWISREAQRALQESSPKQEKRG